MPRFAVGLLKSIKECRQCERIQINTWGGLSVSGEALLVTQKHGGAVVGASFDGRVVGFICAFLARYRGRLIHWSHMMAVEPEFRDQGLGLRMKRVHRRFALEQRIRSICWTYDPLQSRNARLNISRLGGVVDEYRPDYYGRFNSLLEKGLPSDRVVLNWRIATGRVQKRLRGEILCFDPSVPRVNQTQLTAGGLPKNQSIAFNLKNPRLLVEIPARTDEMRSYALPLAHRWRLETRRIFAHYLAAGYCVQDFFAPQPATEGRAFYLLRRHRRG